MVTVFEEIRNLRENMASIVAASGYKNEYLAERINLSPQNFAAKKQRSSWSNEELEKLVNVLLHPNEEVEEMVMLQIAKARKNEPTISLAELKKEMGWK